MLLTEPTYSLSISHQMILLAFAKTEKIRGHSSINTQRTTILIIRLLPPTTLLPESKLSYPQLSPKYSENLFTSVSPASRKSSAPENIQRLFRLQNCLAANHQHPNIFKDFLACRIVLAANHQQPNLFKDLPSNSNQQLRPATATSSSNQQQRPATATSSSNQLQRSTAAINSSNRHQQSAFILPAAPTQSTPTSVSYHYGP